MRINNRGFDQLREVEVKVGVNLYAEGSCMIKFGNTHVLCTATIDDNIPYFLKGKNEGWVTAEYSLLPRSTVTRVKRESAIGKLSGRTQEIQRLIGRSLRSAVDLRLLGERQIIIDCDVLQADGGTRTASITGGYIALYHACKSLIKAKKINQNPIINQVAAISCGIVKGKAMLDLDFIEDSNADVDANFVLGKNNQFVEIQSTAEHRNFNKTQFLEMLSLSEKGVEELMKIQSACL